jgi:predicted MFS family arabinose efflux permease
MGISIAMFCAIIIPTLPMLVKPKQLGTAFGLM